MRMWNCLYIKRCPLKLWGKYKVFHGLLDLRSAWWSCYIHSVRLSVCPEFFSVTTHRKFLIFCMKLGYHLTEKVTSRIFCKKSCYGLFRPKEPKNGPSWGFPSFLENLLVEVFWFFCMKSQQHKVLILT